MKPPSKTKGWYEKFFELLAGRKVDLVDSDFVKVNITSDPGDAGKFIRGLKFLGLINNSGKATKYMEKLRLTGDEFRKNLGEIVQRAYAVVFDKVDLKTVKRENLVNFFIGKYELAADTANRAVDLLVYFAERAGIPVSEELRAAPSAPRPKRDENLRRPIEKPKASSKTTEREIPPEGTIVLQLDNVRIWLPKDDKAAAQTAKDLIDLHIKRNFPNQ